MLFTSLVFIVFACIFFAFWPLANRASWSRWLYIIVFSLIFYGWHEPRHVFLILLYASVDFAAGHLIYHRPKFKKLWLTLAITMNVGVMGYFKYAGFLALNFNYILQPLGMPLLPVEYHVLPLGISFFTFQSMTYTVDIYKGNLKPTNNYLHFLAFLSLFPHLIAGPIVRAGDLLPQMTQPNKVSWADRMEGLRRIIIGLFRKKVISDNLAPAVAAAFATGSSVHSTMFWWAAVTLFAIQVYGDFSGYSEMARGLAKWMGYEFHENFNQPFFATSIQDFWRRWHISLSTWFRDYVYIPLGGSKKGEFRTHLHIWITMLVSGVWHGAAWTYVCWGLWNALLISFERITKWDRKVIKMPVIGPLTANLITLFMFLMGLVFFRSLTFGQVGFVFQQMFTPRADFEYAISAINQAGLAVALLCVIWHFATFLLVPHLKPSERTRRWAETASLAAMVFLVMLVRGPGSTFVYFQF